MMNAFKAAVEKAESEGHVLENDPPGFASVSRKTCKLCGRAVLGNRTTAYGHATEQACPAAKEKKP